MNNMNPSGPGVTVTGSGMPAGPISAGNMQGHGGPTMYQNQIPQTAIGMPPTGPSGMQQHPGLTVPSQHQGASPMAQLGQIKPGASPQLQQPPQQQEIHMTSSEKIKVLVPHLKKSLGNLMRLAAEAIKRDDPSISSGPNLPLNTHALEKAFEEFFALCDQLEMHLSIVLEGFCQVIQHKKYLNPECLKFSFPPTAPPDAATQYAAFTTVVRSQVALATSLHDALAGCADQLSVTPSIKAAPGTTVTRGGVVGNGSAANPATGDS